jgi:CBS domain containing-hemolysin-like protein
VTAGVLLVLALVSLPIAAVSAVGSLILHEFPAHELEELCRRRRREELFGKILDGHDQAALGMQSLQAVGTVVFLITGLWWFSAIVGDSVPPNWSRLGIYVGVGAVALLAATVGLPWALCRYWSAPLLFWTWPLLLAVGRLFLPVTLAGRLIEEIVRRLSGQPVQQPDEEEAFEDEIRAIVSEGLHDGLLEADAREMIEGVIELGDVDVADIMTPRSRMDVLQIDMGWQEVLEFVIHVARTRIPVYGKSLDDIRGILYVKDLLPDLARAPQDRRSLDQLVRPAAFVPRTKAVDDLLREFQRTHNHMAIVVDEYDAVAGLITIEDVLEEIVGEIVDEHDREEQDDIRQLDEYTAEVMAAAHLDEVNERLGFNLPESDEFDTIGGLVVSQLGRIPGAGEAIEIDNVRITILAATPRRVERVRIEDLERSRRETA